MDTTELYITMCEKSPEIQGLRPRDDNEFIPDCYFGLFIFERTKKRENFHLFCVSDDRVVQEQSIWLPRQDELQKMMKYLKLNLHLEYAVDSVWLLYNETRQNFRNEYYESFRSMEQLWLAFVMRKKYHQVWDNDKKDWFEEK